MVTWVEGEGPFREAVKNQDLRVNHLGAERVADHRTMRGRMHKAAHWQKYKTEIQGTRSMAIEVAGLVPWKRGYARPNTKGGSGQIGTGF